MQDFRDAPLEGSDAVIGATVAEARIARSSDGYVQRLALIFEDGATLSIDGRFPANSFLSIEDAVVSSMSGLVFEGLNFLRMEPGPVDGDRRYEEKMEIALQLSGQEFVLTWCSVGYTDYDVDPEPRLNFRPAKVHWTPSLG